MAPQGRARKRNNTACTLKKKYVDYDDVEQDDFAVDGSLFHYIFLCFQVFFSHVSFVY